MPSDRPIKVAMFTDTLDEMNGVSRFIRDIAELAERNGRDLTIVTSSREVRHALPNRVNFPPLYSRSLPFYPDIPLNIPPGRQILKWTREQQFDAIELSTPGSLGLTGRRIAHKLNLPILGVYHTDFPAFVRDITGNRPLTMLTRRFIRWFYGDMTRVFSRTHQYFQPLRELGISDHRMVVTPPFVNLQKFRPACRDDSLWKEMGVTEPYRLLFCGRVSREKNLPMLAQVYRRIAEKRKDIALIIAGFGPYLEEFKRELTGLKVYYLGLLSDVELARLYASSTLYVFPSLTDTLGQVILEAQACGLPVIVSDVGGPKEVVADGQTGVVLPGNNVPVWADTIQQLIDAPERRKRMRDAAVRHVQQYSQQVSFEAFWREFEQVARHSELGAGQAVPARCAPVCS